MDVQTMRLQLSLFIRFRNSNVSNDQSSYIFANCHIQLDGGQFKVIIS